MEKTDWDRLNETSSISDCREFVMYSSEILAVCLNHLETLSKKATMHKKQRLSVPVHVRSTGK